MKSSSSVTNSASHEQHGYPLITIAIVGGDGRRRGLRLPNATIRTFASKKYGAGNTRSLTDSIRGGEIDLVVLLVRWLGHSESYAIASICRSFGVPRVIADRGMASTIRLIEAFVAGKRGAP